MVYQPFLRYLFCYNTINSMHLGGYKIKVSNVWLHYPQIESLQTLSMQYVYDRYELRQDACVLHSAADGGGGGVGSSP